MLASRTIQLVNNTHPSMVDRTEHWPASPNLAAHGDFSLDYRIAYQTVTVIHEREDSVCE